MKDVLLESGKSVAFGRRRMAPRVCVVDHKPHIRTFLMEALEDVGFFAQQCGRASEMNAMLKRIDLDLVVLGLLAPESDVTRVLHVLSLSGYRGRVMLFGARASTALLALHELGERIGLAMLPPLLTPFRDSDLQDNLSEFLPIPASPSVPIDVEEALANKWLELWYQPRIDLQRMSLCAAEAQVRMRHPAWGVVKPDSFIQTDSDPHFRALAEFVVGQALADWADFSQRRSPLELVIPLPTPVFEDLDFVDRLCWSLPEHAALSRLTVEISSIDAQRDIQFVRRAAIQLKACNIALSIDDVMAEVSWIDLGDFPISELQVDEDFISGCAGDRHKRAACGRVLDIAERLGARVMAKGLQASDDFQAVRKMGFDLAQGPLFAKPMDAQRFARTALRRQPISLK